jgi:hypothetical protein
LQNFSLEEKSSNLKRASQLLRGINHNSRSGSGSVLVMNSKARASKLEKERAQVKQSLESLKSLMIRGGKGL